MLATGTVLALAVCTALWAVGAIREEEEAEEAKAPKMVKQRRSVKIVAFSDVHGFVQAGLKTNFDTFKQSSSAKKIEQGKADLLIYGGDLTTGRTNGTRRLLCTKENEDDITKFVKWFATAGTYEARVLVAGNHDGCLDSAKFCLEEDDEKRALMENFRASIMELMKNESIIYLENECQKVSFRDGRSVNIFGAPTSQARPGSRLGAFQYYPGQGEMQYQKVVEQIESISGTCVKEEMQYQKVVEQIESISGTCVKPIVVIHGPPDNINTKYKEAQTEYAKAIAGMTPEIVFAGHFHKGTQQRDGCLQKTTFFPPEKSPRLWMIAVKEKEPVRLDEVRDWHDPLTYYLTWRNNSRM